MNELKKLNRNEQLINLKSDGDLLRRIVLEKKKQIENLQKESLKSDEFQSILTNLIIFFVEKNSINSFKEIDKALIEHQSLPDQIKLIKNGIK